MTNGVIERDGDFVFKRKPKPVPGDLRIAWRMAVTLLALLHSRGQRASFGKLHMVNDALRSRTSKAKLAEMIDGKMPYVYWRMRVEPAFSRNLDFMVGEGFAKWIVTSGRTGLELTAKGKSVANTINEMEDTLSAERDFLVSTKRYVTEGFVKAVIAAGRRLV